MTCTSKIKISVSPFKGLPVIENKRKDQFDQMMVMVNYYHGRGHVQELFKQAFTIAAGCSNYKSGDNGNFDYIREIHQPLREKELLHVQRKDSDSQICRVSQLAFLLPVLCHPNLQREIHCPDQECTVHWIHGSYDHPLPGVRNCQWHIQQTK